jgi:hypothetical protein
LGRKSDGKKRRKKKNVGEERGEKQKLEELQEAGQLETGSVMPILNPTYPL